MTYFKLQQRLRTRRFGLCQRYFGVNVTPDRTTDLSFLSNSSRFEVDEPSEQIVQLHFSLCYLFISEKYSELCSLK